ncbi:extracellular solute-binding protein [Lederbergia citrea]|uniref:extracellular solute-binding protein n=1 Tax=Lederbergia citrea TaxID=2833581 RepID=UPI002015EC78|nr:extracellular solute-binding protein [Lederbergia citrea]
MRSKMLISLVLMLLLVVPHGVALAEKESSIDQTVENVVEERYHTVLEQWKEAGVESASNFEAPISPSNFIDVTEDDLLSVKDSKGYGDRVFYWHNQKSLTYKVLVPEDGLYELSFDYYPLSKEVVPIEGSILVNGEFPYYESRRIVFPVNWKNAYDKFDTDRFGNEIIPNQEAIAEWSKLTAEDASHLQPEPLKFYLKKGSNEIKLSHLRGEMLVGNVYVHSPTKLLSYKDYSANYANGEKTTAIITQEAEKGYTKNSSYIRPVASAGSSIVPNDPKHLLLNTLGGESWEQGGQRVNWNVSIEEEGFYKLTFKVLQNKETGGTVFRKLRIDGDIPFAEAAQIPFEFNKKWVNATIGDDAGEPYLFYFTKGEHEISLEADASPVERTINKINEVIRDMQEFALSIKKLTGNQNDRSRGWKISEYIPDIEDRLANWADQLEEESRYVTRLSTGKQSKDIVSLNMAVQKLRTLNEKPDEIPNRLTELTEGSSSVAQLLGSLLLELPKQPLLVDRFYVHGSDQIPAANAGFWKKTTDSITRFIHSFSAGNYSAANADGKTIEIWVNRPRQYVELIQNLADQTFTPKSGIHVKFSIMPDEGKLILASAANNQPDIAIGISNWLPYELSMRGAAVDLHEFEDFEAYSKQFSPGAFLPLMIDDSVYALPETQDFYVQFYRKDILNALNVPVPDTWDDVVKILPELQRYGMNYYSPIAGAVGFKPFQTTAPFIYQFQGDLYEEDGMKTAIGEEESLRAIQFMANLNTIYSMPMQVPNFYNHFRYSTLPIGISNFTTYIQLTAAAPEIAGWWDIAPHPGITQPDGTVERWATGSGQSAMIFKGTKDREKSWEFLKWWMSTETQTEFASSLQTLYGPEYMWNTANIEAFKKLPWPEEHKDKILEQWEYLKEVPKTPGAYMVERELSNIWNRIVFDGENTRSAVDDSVITINREISRKMEEFGYMKNGKMVRPYHIPTVEQVKSWAGEENED